MTCRDRNLNATKALLLGLSMEGVHNVLVVTGDPIPTEDRNEVKSVFNFNSRKLARFVHMLNENTLRTPFRIYGALNLNARNFDVELRRAQEKRGMWCFRLSDTAGVVRRGAGQPEIGTQDSAGQDSGRDIPRGEPPKRLFSEQ